MKIASLQKQLREQRFRRVRRVRAPMLEAKTGLRLCVIRTSQHIYAQIIDDKARHTLVSYSDMKIKDKKTKTERAHTVGVEVAKLAISKKIKKVVFDRGWHKFHGRVKALAEGAREGGLVF